MENSIVDEEPTSLPSAYVTIKCSCVLGWSSPPATFTVVPCLPHWSLGRLCQLATLYVLSPLSTVLSSALAQLVTAHCLLHSPGPVPEPSRKPSLHNPSMQGSVALSVEATPAVSFHFQNFIHVSDCPLWDGCVAKDRTTLLPASLESSCSLWGCILSCIII